MLQVPSLPPSYGVKKLLNGSRPDDTVTSMFFYVLLLFPPQMSMSTVTGAVIGPSRVPLTPHSGGLMDYFGSPNQGLIPETTGETEEL